MLCFSRNWAVPFAAIYEQLFPLSDYRGICDLLSVASLAQTLVLIFVLKQTTWHFIDQCFSTVGPQPGTGPWHQLYRATRGSPGICHFSFQIGRAHV